MSVMWGHRTGSLPREAAGPVPLALDLHITHDRFWSSSDPSLKWGCPWQNTPIPRWLIVVPLTLSPLCLLLLVRLVGYIVNVYTFYSCRLIGKLTAFLQNSFRSSVSVNQLALAPYGVPCQDFSVRVVALRTAASDPLEFVSRSYASDQSRFRFQ
jgi:hypothetical protein